MITPGQIRAAYLRACDLDVAAFKPGNVSDYAPGHYMDAVAFRTSAQESAVVLADPDKKLGERVYAAVEATRKSVTCNTNLGIILLCAPMAQATLDDPCGCLRENLERLLHQLTTVEDTENVYQAIRLAAPGGLGSSPEHDVAEAPAVDLRTAMARADSWDQIASEYASGFKGVWDRVLPYLDEALDRWYPDLLRATTDLYLFLLATQPDTHVRRRNGARTAQDLCDEAKSMRRRFLAYKDPGHVDRELESMDFRLKKAGINPGTTADLVVAGHFLARLRDVRADSAGTCPGPPKVISTHYKGNVTVLDSGFRAARSS